MTRDYVLEQFRAPVDLQIDYASALNPQQLAAVTAPPGPALVIAGAGAGKTRTLIYRVAYLLEQGIPADRLLLLTFTNKAAREMMSRVSDLLGRELPELWGGTFHSMGHRVLRRHAEQAGYGPDFTILDSEDARDLMKECLAEAGFDRRERRFPKADALCEVLSFVVNTRQNVPEVLARQFDYFTASPAQVAELQTRYQARKRADNVMDFDDLLALWLRLLETHDALREQYQRRFQFILVDEYQDTNRIQADLIDLLAARHQAVMVVGDDSQSIYSWRGACFQNILEFPRRYPKTVTYRIETNYRSTPEILTVANAAIRANVHQFPKDLAPVRSSGTKPVLVGCEDAAQQAAFVAQRVRELREEGAALNRVAVLYRSHFHTLELQLELVRSQISFSITSGIRFFEQAHLKDVTAHLRLVCNPRDELAFKRLARLQRGVGPRTADRLWRLFLAQNPRTDSPEPPASPVPIAHALEHCAGAVPKAASRPWAQFVATVSQLEDPKVRARPDRMIRLVIEAGYEDYLKQNYANYRARREDLDELAGFARQFESLEDCLTQLSLLSNLEAEESRSGPTDDDRLRLSTIHQAKGLEFDVVFVIMLCEGLFPNARALRKPEEEEEERRLFYVAITRARNALYLTYPLRRAFGGAPSFEHPSRFLDEIPPDLLDVWNLVPGLLHS